MKKNTKRKIATALTVILLASMMLPASFNLLARDTLSGIREKAEDIAEREDSMFRVLEIVPDRSQARIGYYFEGQEPFQIYEKDGTKLLDSWDEETKTWKPWQSGLEQFADREHRENYVNHAMEVLWDENKEIADLITISGNTISGNTVSGNTAEMIEGPNEGELCDTPILFSTYKEVDKEQYDLDPAHYRQYQIGGGDKKGYFNYIGNSTYNGDRFQAAFAYYGNYVKAEKTKGYYTIKEEVLITDITDSAWDTRVKEAVYASNGDGTYSFAGSLQDIRDALSPPEVRTNVLEDDNPPEEAEEDKPEEDKPEEDKPEEDKPEENKPEEDKPEENNPDIDKPEENVPENEENEENTGNDSGSSQDNGTGSETESTQELTSRLENREKMHPFSTPSTTKYYYLNFEWKAAPSEDDGNSYYTMTSYTPDETGAWGYTILPDDDTSLAENINMGGTLIYYEGGFFNQEWVKRYSFDMEEDTFSSFNTEVTTMTPEELNNWKAEAENQFTKFDFIVIKDASNKDGSGTSISGFADGADMGEGNAQQLFSDIMEAKIPTVVDSAIVFAEDANAGTGTDTPSLKVINDDMKDKVPSLWKLSALLLQSNPAAVLFDKDENGDRPPFVWDITNVAIDWTKIEANIGFVEDVDKNYVNHNIYSLYGKTVVNNEFEKNIWNSLELEPDIVKENMEGFEDVLLEIENENMYREADTSWEGEPLPTDVKQSAAVRYIINYSYQRAAYLKTNINILDIEPTYPNEDSFPLTVEDVRGWLSEDSPIRDEDIHITTMTVAEFIGKNEDLNEKYDMIYIGTDTDRLNMRIDSVTRKYRTVFNDRDMNGLVYFHTGDTRTGSIVLAGQLDTDYENGRVKNTTKVRYSGLDLTQNKVEDLISYTDASYPIVLSDDFYTKDKDGNTIIDAGYIDSSSYMYKFVNQMLEEKKVNVFSRQTLGMVDEGGKPNVKLFSFYLNRPKLNLTTDVTCGSVGENGVYNILEKDGHYTLEYRFTISNIGAVSMETRYHCELYVDVNADGKFSPLERIDDVSVSSGGSEVSQNDLKAGTTYTLRRRVPDGYKGVLSWRVKVAQNGNDNIRASTSGYSKMDGMKGETLNILQICRAVGADYRINLEREFNDKNSMYFKLVNGGTIGGKKYSGIKEDFDINVKFVEVSEFERMYAADRKVLNDYNMLILGFSDMYDNLSEVSLNGQGGITEFIESGKSVLFAHDTTSFINIPNAGSYNLLGDVAWAYNMNRFVRPLVGMDRYGVNELSIAKDENGEVTSVKNTARSTMLKRGSRLSNADGSDWNILTENTAKDVAYKAKSNRTEAVSEVQGYTYTIIDFKDIRNQEYLGYNFKEYAGWDDITDNNGAGNYNVTQVNAGQITTYPYKLSDKFPVSLTHGQYYQLDMNADDDQDGETDLVVWYCLDSWDDGGKSLYSISPNDVANNYYIYNKGNITYTGMGHAGREGAINERYVEEAKLFINTMIAAYNASIKSAEVEIIDPVTEKKINDICRYYDSGNAQNFEDSEEDYQKVYFKVEDLNFVKGSKKITAKFYLETENGTNFDYMGEQYKVTPLTVPVYYADKDEDDGNDALADAGSLVSGRNYYVRIPRADLLQKGNRQSIFVEANSIIVRYNQTIITPSDFDKVDMVQLQLFELD